MSPTTRPALLALATTALTLAVSACGSSGSSTDAASPTMSASTAAPTTTSDSPAGSTSAVATTAGSVPTTSGTQAGASSTAPASSTAAATSAAPAAALPSGSMLLLSTVPPKTVGTYSGKQLELNGLGKGTKTQWEYTDAANDRDMSLVATTVPHSTMVKNLQGTGTPLGRFGSCGYLYGSKSTPVCMIRLENGANLTVNGDSRATLEQTRAFATAFLAAAKTK